MSTRDELEKAAEWFEELSSYHSNPTLMAKEKLAATALREKASAVNSFDVWVDSDSDNDPLRGEYNHKRIWFYAERAYAAGHAAANVRVAELERERALLVAEVRRCWAEEEREFYDALVNSCARPYEAQSRVDRLIADRSAEVRAIVEAQP